MNYIKGVRFHPTDAEALELLRDKVVLDRDSTVQVGDALVQLITQLKDICEFQPWELPGLSELESGDNLWYFFCSPRYKYRNSKRKNRVTKKGYWKPTGTPRDIVITYNGKEISGSRQTLVFYLGRVGDENRNENKTPWVIHEFKLNLPNQESLTLCKLKKKSGKLDVSRSEKGQSSQFLPSNLENHCTNNAIPKEQLTESEAFTEYSGFQSQITTTEQEEYEFVGSFLTNGDEFYSNQPYLDDKNEGPKLASNSQIHQYVDNDIPKPKNQEGLCELINQKPKASADEVAGTINEVWTSEHDSSSWSSILIANDQTYSKLGSSLFAEKESSSWALENPVAVDSFPMLSPEHPEFDEFLRHGIFMVELSAVPKEPKSSDGVQNHEFSTNEQNVGHGLWNSITAESLSG